MKCPGINEMAACLDGVLSASEGARLGEHFRVCARCRKALEELSRLLALGPLDPGRDGLRAARAVLSRGEHPLVMRSARPLAPGLQVRGTIN